MGIRFFPPSQLSFGALKFLVEKRQQIQMPTFLTCMRRVPDESEQFSEILCFSSLFKIDPVRSFKNIKNCNMFVTVFNEIAIDDCCGDRVKAR